jgi:hypothetical protein
MPLYRNKSFTKEKLVLGTGRRSTTTPKTMA